MHETASLLDLTQTELAGLLAGWGQPRYRAGQVWNWIYRKLAGDPAEMTDLPKALRERLAAETRVDPLERIYVQRSRDQQTVKWLSRFRDGLTIETVLMLYDDVSGSARERRTVCISTQAGCAMGCVFCATGQAGLARNLTSGEIVAQVLAAARWLAGESANQRISGSGTREWDGNRQSAIGHRLSAIGHRPSVISYRPSAIAISHQLSAI